MEELVDALQKAGVGEVKRDEPLKKHTTWKIGGPADVLVAPDGTKNLKRVIEIVQQHGVSWRAIGRGSNLLVGDEGLRGVVIKMGENLAGMDVSDKGLVTVGGGYSLIKLTTLLSKQGWSGLEFAGGIPGTVGGAVFMNAGAHGSEMVDIVTEALILYPDGSLVWEPNENLGFQYRTSNLQKNGGICAEAKLQLTSGDKESITAKMQANKDYRRDTQPWNYPCAGSVFRNPLPKHAGHLIEKAGLKGYQIGGAQFSELHGNFIVNIEDASAQDVKDLIEHARTTVANKFGVEMETEVEIIAES
ncbi:UDP-N-acetylmuramate dehydrogenase [Salsuginibacillus halophilus]|uniref:UDP-N-acetylenolpyruvoylglucosamine reductase n=1 Tax=Salsuginibacillus halophilus TaxID=517424 RepID=A0A2P8HX20_9BACI|nr:UDP-N-acetylmuramate dehydrogenase [Salsuginibacillus halophilus]PSL50769.1 UDP-N-acetylmuramate dehydrogenase [Salsuginibacillus halophilus]